MKRFSHTSSTDTAPADINEAIETTLAVCRNEYKYVAEQPRPGRTAGVRPLAADVKAH
jgi:hypothetical protein